MRGRSRHWRDRVHAGRSTSNRNPVSFDMHSAHAVEPVEPNLCGPAIMNYAKIYSDPDGVSHFQTVGISFVPGDFPSEGGSVVRSDFRSAEAGFICVPSGWDSGWHNSPGDGFAILLQGNVEIEVGSGEVRRFSPGEVWRSTDTSGRGHISRVVSEEDALVYMSNFKNSES